MASGASETVSLRRKETGTPWGFRMQGGREHGMPLFISKVSPKSIAGKAGLGVGDVILQICGTSCIGFTHQDGKNELMRAGNEVDFKVQRNAVDVDALRAASGQSQESRSELVEESINPGMNEGSKFRNVTPKTYKILEQQLSSHEPQPSALGGGGRQQQQQQHHQQQQRQPAQHMPAVHATRSDPPTAAGKPSSIFDRKRQDRSDYLVAQGNTIQKVFGEQ